MTNVARRPYSRHGEIHHRAKLTDAEVELIRSLREEDERFWSYGKLAEKFDVGRTTIADIIQMRKRIGPAVRT